MRHWITFFLDKTGHPHIRMAIPVILLALPVVTAGGCSGTKEGQLPTASVSGQVRYRGVPVPRGTIMFIPIQSGEGVRVASATLDDEGCYRLGTYARDDGAVVGNFTVVVESREELPSDATIQRKMTNDGLVSTQPPKSLIPERYGKTETSGLTARVEAGSNQLDFDLKDN